MRLVLISDTHGLHRDVVLPRGDILIHAGDFSDTGRTEQVVDFHAWLCELNHFKRRVVIAGNHDITFHKQYYVSHGALRFHRKEHCDPDQTRSVLTDSLSVDYLQDSSVEIEGLKFYGSPWSPDFCQWAFNLPRGSAELREVWSKIPSSTDILITHGPPAGHGDRCQNGVRAGCVDLLHEIDDRIRPMLHIFGHIHEGYGVTQSTVQQSGGESKGLSRDGVAGRTFFANASSCTVRYQATNAAIVFDVDPSTGQVTQVCSRVHRWSSEQVGSWLDQIGTRNDVRGYGAGAGADGGGGGNQSGRSPGFAWVFQHFRRFLSTMTSSSVGDEAAEFTGQSPFEFHAEYDALTPGVISGLRGLTGSQLLSRNGEYIPWERMGVTSIREQIQVNRAIRRLEAENM